MSETTGCCTEASGLSFRPDALLVPTSKLSMLAMTTDQARILCQVLIENRENITHRWSSGIWDGLLEALWNIEKSGGAYTRKRPTAYMPR